MNSCLQDFAYAILVSSQWQVLVFNKDNLKHINSWMYFESNLHIEKKVKTQKVKPFHKMAQRPEIPRRYENKSNEYAINVIVITRHPKNFVK